MPKLFISHGFDADPALLQSLRGVVAGTGFDLLEPRAPHIVPADVVASRYRGLSDSDVVLAVLDQLRPNVLLELGMALGFGKDVIIVAQPNLELPVDIAAVPCVQLTTDPTDALPWLRRQLTRLRERVERTRSRREDARNESPLRKFEPMGPQEFETFVADVFRNLGYAVALPQQGLDSGCDLILTVPGSEELILVEAKKYSPQHRVSVEHVRRLFGVTHVAGGAAGILVTTSDFTSSARELAVKMRPPVRLMTADELLEITDRRNILP